MVEGHPHFAVSRSRRIVDVCFCGVGGQEVCVCAIGAAVYLCGQIGFCLFGGGGSVGFARLHASVQAGLEIVGRVDDEVVVVHLDARGIVGIGCYGVKSVGKVAIVPELFVLSVHPCVVPIVLYRTVPGVSLCVVLHMVMGHDGLLFTGSIRLIGIYQEIGGKECACGARLLCALVQLAGEQHRVCTICIDILDFFQHIFACAGEEKQHTECCQGHADPGKHQCIGYFCTVVHLGLISSER